MLIIPYCRFFAMLRRKNCRKTFGFQNPVLTAKQPTIAIIIHYKLYFVKVLGGKIAKMNVKKANAKH